MKSKKQQIKSLVKDMLIESNKRAIQTIDRVLNSGCIDIEAWDDKNAPMHLPKTITTAILEDRARQYTARGTSYEKAQKKEVKNIRMFI